MEENLESGQNTCKVVHDYLRPQHWTLGDDGLVRSTYTRREIRTCKEKKLKEIKINK
jgi:hypothetical protein